MRIAFHTPLHPFDDGGISGDRRMARQLATALASLGHDVAPVEAPPGYQRTADAPAFARFEAEAGALREQMIGAWRSDAPAPDLWFTYHSYYRAPDLLGPEIARRLAIPYVVAEASDAPRRARGEWAAQSTILRRSLAEADLHLHFTERDRLGLEPWCGEHTALLGLPPFLALDGEAPRQRLPGSGAPRLVTVAMMRAGVKQDSYLALARILHRLMDRPWTLAIIGDGSQRHEIEQAFAGFEPGRIAWMGAMAHESVVAALSGHDILVWPGMGEAYGLVYLEAQAVGLPVVAFDSGGVSATLKPGETGLLAREGDEAGFAAALARLLDDPDLREAMGAAARRFVLEERSLTGAAAILAQALTIACANRQARRRNAPRATMPGAISP